MTKRLTMCYMVSSWVLTELLAGCTTPSGRAPQSEALSSYGMSERRGQAPLGALIEEIEQGISAADPQTSTEVEDNAEIPAMTLELNANVERWIEYFTTKDRARFQRFLSRGAPYRAMIEATLTENNVPKELYFLALIESGFQTNAASHAQAVGIWQFIKGTGKRYGLAVNRYNDERMDPIRSTKAASAYLGNLHNVFNSWYLAMAAYNAGESRIMNAIMRENSRNFWTLVRRRALPRETMEYIPKFIAAATIGRNPESFGFDLSPTSEAAPELTAVELPAGVSFREIEQRSGVSVSTLRQLNPGLKRSMTPPGSEPYRILIPKAQAETFAAEIPQLTSQNIRVASNQFDEAKEDDAEDLPSTHRVKRGETLASIAERYNSSVEALRRLNHLRSRRVATGRILKIKPNTADAESSLVSTTHYKVQPGDSLKTISARFRIPVRSIKAANSLKTNKIYAGDILKITSRQG